MTLQTKQTGRRGERLAEEYFVSVGAELLERNYFRDHTEVDLLLKHEGELVAVEVKTRDVEDFVAPEECVRWSQLSRVARGLATYAMDNDLMDWPWRIDVVLIVIHEGDQVLRFDHLKSVYPG